MAIVNVKCIAQTIANGDGLVLTEIADRRYFIQNVWTQKLGGAGGAGDAIDVTVAGVSAGSVSLNGQAAGQMTNITLGVVEVNVNEVISFIPTLGAGDNAVRVFVNLVPAE